jgi:GTP-binding protein HflX
VVALVGYTNAGKTTLLNRLTGATLRAADELFVTLDPVARLVNGDRRPSFVLTDTVGFIRKLPHELVAAFRATLEELAEADVLLHVVDASHPQLEEHLKAVETLLDELQVAERPRLLVLNKLDRLEDPDIADGLVRLRGGVAVSARTGEGVTELLDAIGALLPRRNGPVTLRIPHAEGAALASCYTRGRVLMRADEPQHVRLHVELPVDLLGPLATYRV